MSTGLELDENSDQITHCSLALARALYNEPLDGVSDGRNVDSGPRHVGLGGCVDVHWGRGHQDHI